MIIEEYNIKLRDAILEQRANNIVKDIKKVYDERYSYIEEVAKITNN
jgi:hypothetical protein